MIIILMIPSNNSIQPQIKHQFRFRIFRMQIIYYYYLYWMIDCVFLRSAIFFSRSASNYFRFLYMCKYLSSNQWIIIVLKSDYWLLWSLTARTMQIWRGMKNTVDDGIRNGKCKQNYTSLILLLSSILINCWSKIMIIIIMCQFDHNS